MMVNTLNNSGAFPTRYWQEGVYVTGWVSTPSPPAIWPLLSLKRAYAVSDRGACHLRATFYKPELSGMIEPGAIVGKAKLFIDYEDRLTLFDSFIFCRFFRDLILWEDLLTVTKALTGLDFSKEELQQVAAHITDNTRHFNLREGVSRSDDRLPVRLTSEPIGENNEHLITEEELETLVSDYYRLRGWDEEGRLA
jgi:aldehyde:ferredoxin oxidoreductase